MTQETIKTQIENIKRELAKEETNYNRNFLETKLDYLRSLLPKKMAVV